MSGLRTVHVASSGLTYSGPEIDTGALAIRCEETPSAFMLGRDRPGTRPVYFRIDRGRLEWGDDFRAFVAGPPQTLVSPGVLLALVHGFALPPDATPVPGLRRLALGTHIRVDPTGIVTTREAPPVPTRTAALTEAIGTAMKGGGGEAIAYSGGLASAFLAACVLAGGRRPALLHACSGADEPALPEIPSLTIEHVRMDPLELLDWNQVTGSELLPPLPDAHFMHQVMARLGEAAGQEVISGALLEDLLSVKLPDVPLGIRGRRLLTCEPFHAAGSVLRLKQARDMVGRSSMRAPNAVAVEADPADVQPVAGAQPASGDPKGALPGLTETARQALRSAWLGATPVWNEHFNELDPLYARLDAGLEERGLVTAEPGGGSLPALAPEVVAAVAALRPSQLGRIRGGFFVNHLPMRRELAALDVSGIREASRAFRLRFAAATYLHRERKKIVADLQRNCAMADLGLVEPATISGVLLDGSRLSEHALPLLRLLWLDRWLRG